MLAAREPTITKPSKAAPCSKQECHVLVCAAFPFS